ncbi:MAG: peptide deformylase [bacterium]|nr:peptide deformylase [bacterium]
MSSLNLITIPNPLLRQKAVNVTVFDDKLEARVNNMFDIMIEQQGVGLAAVQVGILERIIVVRYEGSELSLINPEILNREGKTIDVEACLSVPGRQGYVVRDKCIRVKGQNFKGEPVEMEQTDFMARIVQHEMDHLDGILFIDKLEDFS